MNASSPANRLVDESALPSGIGRAAGPSIIMGKLVNRAQESPIRVAVVTQGYQGGGGVRSTARWLVRRLTDAGYVVSVFDIASSIRDPYSRQLRSPATWFRRSLVIPDPTEPDVKHVGANGVEVEILRYLPRAELTRHLNRFDLVQVVTGGPALALVAARARPPVVLQVASTVAWERASLDANRSPLALWRGLMCLATTHLENYALRRTTKVLVLNRQMLSYVDSHATVQVELLATGIDIHRFAPAEGGWDPSGYILSLCRLNDQRKGLDRLIRAYCCIVKVQPDAPSLVLAGKGPMPRALADLIMDLGVGDKVITRIDLTDAELPNLYRGASVFLQMSFEEGLGLSVLEAMACGLPVVATNTAGTFETVTNGESGWLIEQDSEVVSTAAQRVLSIWNNDGLEMALASRVRAVDVYSDDQVFARYCGVYNELLAE